MVRITTVSAGDKRSEKPEVKRNLAADLKLGSEPLSWNPPDIVQVLSPLRRRRWARGPNDRLEPWVPHGVLQRVETCDAPVLASPHLLSQYRLPSAPKPVRRRVVADDRFGLADDAAWDAPEARLALERVVLGLPEKRVLDNLVV